LLITKKTIFDLPLEDRLFKSIIQKLIQWLAAKHATRNLSTCKLSVNKIKLFKSKGRIQGVNIKPFRQQIKLNHSI